MMHFSETVLVYDMKIGRRIQPNECNNFFVFQRSKPSTDHAQRSLRLNVFKWFF